MLHKQDFKIKDIGQADWGRKEMELAEVEMPGLMQCRKKYGAEQPLKGKRISGSLHTTIQTTSWKKSTGAVTDIGEEWYMNPGKKILVKVGHTAPTKIEMQRLKRQQKAAA